VRFDWSIVANSGPVSTCHSVVCRDAQSAHLCIDCRVMAATGGQYNVFVNLLQTGWKANTHQPEYDPKIDRR